MHDRMLVRLSYRELSLLARGRADCSFYSPQFLFANLVVRPLTATDTPRMRDRLDGILQSSLAIADTMN